MPDETTGQPGLLERSATWSSRFLLCSAAVVVLALLLVRLRVVVLPLIIALMLTSVLAPVARWLTRRRVPRALVALLALLLPVGAILVAFVLAIPPAVSQMGGIIAALQKEAGGILHGVQHVLRLSPANAASLTQEFSQATRGLGSLFFRGVTSGIPVVIEVAAGAILTVAFLFYMLLDGPGLWNRALTTFPSGSQPVASLLGHNVWTTLRGYLRGILIVATFDATLIGVGFFVLRVPLAGAIALLIFFGAFIPVVGAAAAGVAGVLVALAHGGWHQAVPALIVVVVVQQIETNIVNPYAVGRAVRLHPLVALVAVATGAALWGILGAVLAVPALALAVSTISDARSSRLDES